jgi:protein tyrosine/serine phosphatase
MTDRNCKIATIYGPAYTAVFKHIIEHPTDPLLFHCSAGKDRTGVLAALLMRLAGVGDDLIAEDYTLTRLGVEPGREMLTEILKKYYGGVSRDTPGFKELSECKAVNMVAFLKRLDEKWGSAEGYLEKELGFEKSDIDSLKKNISAISS